MNNTNATQPKEFFLDGLKELEQRSHKCVELRGEYVEEIYFFDPVACFFLYKAKDLASTAVKDHIVIFYIMIPNSLVGGWS
jgi:hypothetical protein